jgi:hypothetical protein
VKSAAGFAAHSKVNDPARIPGLGFVRHARIITTTTARKLDRNCKARARLTGVASMWSRELKRDMGRANDFAELSTVIGWFAIDNSADALRVEQLRTLVVGF